MKILVDDGEKDFVVINFDEYFKYLREKLHSKLCNEQNLWKVAELLYIFLTTPDKVMIWEMMLLSYFDNCIYHFNIKVFNLFNSDLQSISTKPIIKKQIKRVVKWAEKL